MQDMNITATCTKSTDMAHGIADVVEVEEPPFRARRARFDRPALTLDELMRADGGDFVHLACWTVVGRRATRSEHAAWQLLMAQRDGKIALLNALVRLADTPPAVPGLAPLLLVHRRAELPWIGPLFAALTRLTLRYRSIGAPARFMRRLPGRVRWTYRHARKALWKLAARLRFPTRNHIRMALQTGHVAPPSGTDPRAVVLYGALCSALDQKTDTR